MAVSKHRPECPTCGSRISNTEAASKECWYCEGEAEQRAEEEAFRRFMEQDKETRWFQLWKAAIDAQ